jgi:pSer/pThr/pTyr-binding forkhead associated (FHA) protein
MSRVASPFDETREIGLPGSDPGSDAAVAEAVARANAAAQTRKALRESQLDALSLQWSAGEGAPPPPPRPTGAAPHFLICPVLQEPVTLSVTEPLKIGRGEDNGLVFPLTQVSRRHAEIRFDSAASAYVIHDRQSLNGTFVNGKSVRRRPLHDGDRIAIGPFRLIYRSHTGGDRPRGHDETDALNTGALAGELSEVPITDVVRLLESLQKTGELAVFGPMGERGLILFRNGSPVHAEWKVSIGAPAAHVMLRLKAGGFRFSAKPIQVAKDTIFVRCTTLIEEAGRP